MPNVHTVTCITITNWYCVKISIDCTKDHTYGEVIEGVIQLKSESSRALNAQTQCTFSC